MPWTVEGPAVAIHADGAVAPLLATSTSTVWLPAGPDGPARLRMFVDDGMLAGSLPDRAAWGRLVGENPCGLRDRVFTFLDAVVRPFAPPRFTVTPGGAPLAPTCVPARRSGVTWGVQLARRDGPALEDARLDVIYKDPAVARLPDGTWLLAAARYRVRAQDRPRDYFTVEPGSSLGDIVAWRAADPAFREGVAGPYWLVDGRAALPGEAGLAWLGVPGVAVTGAGADARVDVYYVVEPDEAGGRSYRVTLADPAAAAPPDPTGHGQGEGAARGPAGPGTPSPRGAGHDAAEGPSNRDGPRLAADGPRREPPGGPRLAGIRPGVAVKRFDWATLSTWLAVEPPDEARWESGDALPGALLGRVRVWMAGDTPGEARPIEAAFGGAALRLADPAPFSCPPRSGAGLPDLFVAAIYDTRVPAAERAPSGHGVWRAAGLPDGADLCARADGAPRSDTCEPVSTREGVDFLVAAGGRASPDRVVATTARATYGDPDPLRLPWGRAWVAAGDFLLGPDTLGLAAVRGGAADVCRPWKHAWR